MKISWTKAELIEALKDFNDDDEILINIHDDVFYEDNYQFYLDPIHMGLDSETNEDRGHQIWLCPVQNVEDKEVTVDEAKEKLRHFYELDLGNCTMTNESWLEELAKACTTHRHSYYNNFLIEYSQYLKEREDGKHVTFVEQEIVNKVNHLELRSDLENDNIFDTYLQACGKTHNSPEVFTISCITVKDDEWITDYHYDSKTEYEQDVKLLNL